MRNTRGRQHQRRASRSHPSTNHLHRPSSRFLSIPSSLPDVRRRQGPHCTQLQPLHQPLHPDSFLRPPIIFPLLLQLLASSGPHRLLRTPARPQTTPSRVSQHQRSGIVVVLWKRKPWNSLSVVWWIRIARDARLRLCCESPSLLPLEYVLDTNQLRYVSLLSSSSPSRLLLAAFVASKLNFLLRRDRRSSDPSSILIAKLLLDLLLRGIGHRAFSSSSDSRDCRKLRC